MDAARTKILPAVVLGVCLTLLSGCGTILGHRTGTFDGVNEDIKIVSEPLFWVVSLGLVPLMAIVSMPVDLGVDIVLYPYDAYQKSKPVVVYMPPPVGYSAPLYSINLTGASDFDYMAWPPYSAPTGNTDFIENAPFRLERALIAKAVAAPDPKSGVEPVAGTINPAQLFAADPRSSGKAMSFHKVGPVYQAPNGVNYRNTIKIKQTLLASAEKVADKSIIIYFMPCNELVFVRSNTSVYDPGALNQPEVQAVFKSLKQQAAQGKCPLPAPHNKAVLNPRKVV